MNQSCHIVTYEWVMSHIHRGIICWPCRSCMTSTTIPTTVTRYRTRSWSLSCARSLSLALSRSLAFSRSPSLLLTSFCFLSLALILFHTPSFFHCYFLSLSLSLSLALSRARARSHALSPTFSCISARLCARARSPVLSLVRFLSLSPSRPPPTGNLFFHFFCVPFSHVRSFFLSLSLSFALLLSVSPSLAR